MSHKAYTFEQELDPKNEDYLKWFIWDWDGMCINEQKPFNTQQEAEEYIPNYESGQAERAWERMYELGETRAEMNERHHKEQKLK